jgi:hypothetical protein
MSPVDGLMLRYAARRLPFHLARTSNERPPGTHKDYAEVSENLFAGQATLARTDRNILPPEAEARYYAQADEHAMAA